MSTVQQELALNRYKVKQCINATCAKTLILRQLYMHSDVVTARYVAMEFNGHFKCRTKYVDVFTYRN